jgi:hypothetical protein
MLTTTDFTISAKVQSSAIAHLSIVRADGDSWAWDLLVTFNNSDKVYRYAWEDEGECERWFALLSDDEDKAATSWGQLFNRALKHGDIEQIDI